MHSVDHGWGDELELYVSVCLATDQTDRLEDHLLQCGQCRIALDEAVVFHRAMRTGLALQEEFKPRPWFEWLRYPAFTAATALILVAGAGWYARQPLGHPVPLAVIELHAMRGDTTNIELAEQTELRMTDSDDAPGTVEVVDAGGQSVWKGAKSSGHSVRIVRPLAPGTYIVRLYERSKLLHEYSFRVNRNQP